MEQFLRNLLTASIHGSVVILAILPLRLILRRTPKKYICLLWLLAGVRLLLPIELRSELSLQPAFSLPLAGLAGVTWAAYFPWVWGSIAAGFAVYSLVSYLRLKDKVRQAVRIRGGWESDRIETAFILGFIKPRIYIPMGMSQTNRQHILAHERTHLDKGDHWIKMIGFLALALHWFNPLVWVAYILLCRDIEMACDERVVRFMELDERKSYSYALLSCSSRRAHFASPVAFGEVSVKARILGILNYKKPGFWMSLLGVAAFFFVAICLLTSPPDDAAPSLTPEQKAQQETIAACREDLEALFSQEEFCFYIDAGNASGDALWHVKLFRLEEDTLWQFTSGSLDEVTDGGLERSGKHYARYGGGWMETGEADTRFEDWLELFLWNPDTAAFASDTETESGRKVEFTSQWTGANQTVHTQTVTMVYSLDGKLVNVRIAQPNYENADYIYLTPDPLEFFYEGTKSVSDFFTEADGAILSGTVTPEELEAQTELNDWGVRFRVDDDRLTCNGSDVAFSQDQNGRGILSTTDAYWLEKQVDGNWEMVPTLTTPVWAEEGIGVAKGIATYGYLDWTPLYGSLEAGLYRMGKTFHCYDRESNYSKKANFYSEFRIVESVDLNSPEAKAAVERCYAKVEELKQKKTLHWLSIMGRDSEQETWIDGENFLRVTHWNGPDAPEEEWSENDKRLAPRTDTSVRYEGVGYATLREDPDNLTSRDLGLAISTLSPNRGGWTWTSFADDFNILYFERGNHAISFPEGIGVVSDGMVRFAENWTISGGMECGAVLTYRFDGNGALCYMEYKTQFEDGHEYIASITILGDTDEAIREKIRAAAASPVVESFSWEKEKAKYTSGDFNIRQDSFANTGAQPVTGAVEAARLAMKEYPNLSNILSFRVCRDEEKGMWKVTIKTEVEVQSLYDYRDIYLDDSGATRLLVYEGPLSFDQDRK